MIWVSGKTWDSQAGPNSARRRRRVFLYGKMTGCHGQARRTISGVPPLLDSYAVSRPRRRMKTVRRSFSAHYIICGYTERARRLASEISRRSLPFVVVSDDPEELAAVRESGAPHVAGSP